MTRYKNNLPILPRATAVWLIENTALTFKQIGDFCNIHEFEVQGIADGEISQGVIGVNPIINGQLTREEILRCSSDKNAILNLSKNNVYEHMLSIKNKNSFKYIPIARRQDKPNAIFWLLKNYPDITNAQIIKLIGTTKASIESIKNRTYWNMKNINPRDPVLLGICTQIELDFIISEIKSIKQCIR